MSSVSLPAHLQGYQRADAGRRVMAALIDGLVSAFIIAAMSGITFLLSAAGGESESGLAVTVAGAVVHLLGWLGILALTYGMVLWRGQTVGRLIMQVAWVPLQEPGPVRFRGVLKLFLEQVTTTLTMGILPIVVAALLLKDGGSEPFSLYDKMAGTYCLSTQGLTYRQGQWVPAQPKQGQSVDANTEQQFMAEPFRFTATHQGVVAQQGYQPTPYGAPEPGAQMSPQAPAQPAPAQPAVAQPAPSQPTVAQPAYPAQPVPVQPVPAQPAPAQPVPTQAAQPVLPLESSQVAESPQVAEASQFAASAPSAEAFVPPAQSVQPEPQPVERVQSAPEAQTSGVAAQPPVITEVPWSSPAPATEPTAEPTAEPAATPVAVTAEATPTKQAGEQPSLQQEQPAESVAATPAACATPAAPVVTSPAAEPAAVVPPVEQWNEEVPQALNAMSEATQMLAPAAATGAADVAAGEPEEEPDDEATIAVADLQAHASFSAPIVTLDNGQQFAVTSTVILGRNPNTTGQWAGTMSVAVHDPQRSISKTHLAVSVDVGGVFIEDLGSVNGTVVVNSDGSTTQVPQGVRVAVPFGSTVRFGERSLTITAPTAS